MSKTSKWTPFRRLSGSYAGRLEVLGGPDWASQRFRRGEGADRRRESRARRRRRRYRAPTWRYTLADIRLASSLSSGRWRRRKRLPLLPAFVPLTVDHGPRTARSSDIVEVAIGDILIRVGRDVSEEHLARIFRAARAAT